MQNNILVIGGNGYIGSELLNHIEADSVDLCSFGPDLGHSIKINYNDFDISSYKTIILLAGHSSVQMSEYNPDNCWHNNATYFFNLCKKLSKDQLLIYASSGSVYGQKHGVSSEHDLNIEPINYYDLSKVTIDIIANKFIADGKNIIGLRFGTVNGASPNTRADLMINSMVYSYKTKGFIQTNNDWIKRPILGLQDLIKAIKKILASEVFYSGQYNLCSFNSTVKEIADAVAKRLSCEIIKTSDSRKVYDFEISSSKFQRTYGFEFNETIESIIESLVDLGVEKFSRRDADDRLFNDNL